MGLKQEYLKLLNIHKSIGNEFPEYVTYQQAKIYSLLEDVHSVGSATELQEAIDNIATSGEAGTIFIESGTHEIATSLTIDGGGSYVIYGHGDNTILKPADGIPVFNITDCQSLIIKTLQIDASNYTGATSSVIVNETNDNVISIEDVTIVGNNLGIGIELVSDNCMIEHCNISLMQDGIYINNSNRQIITQNIIQNNVRYGINIDTILYSLINLNTCNLNLTGIYLLNSTNNSISNNISNQNTENGIYIHSSSYNTLSGNTCENNDSNTANPQAGMFITNNSNFNTISANSLNNNNNIGAGDGYGLLIATATCEENVVASNNYNGNDIDIKDIGVGTTVEYYVQNVDELQDAINSIGSGAGIININSSFNVSVTIVIDGNGSYLIEGEGDNTVLTTVGDISCFNIDIARQVVFKNFKIDASSLTTATREIIDVNENNDNLIVFENVSITGDGTNGYGIELNSNNCRINNCNIDNVSIGINILSTDNMLQGNKTLNCNINGIKVEANNNMLNTNTCSNNVIGIYLNSANYSLIIGNYFENNTQWGINLNDSNYNSIPNNYCISNDGNSANPIGGIGIDGNSDNNMLIGNTSINNNNIGAEDGYGIYLGVGTDNNHILANWLSGNDDDEKDLGNNTTFSIAGHLHDGETLNLDGVNSNGGVFDFATTGQVNFNQNVSLIAGGVIVGTVQLTDAIWKQLDNIGAITISGAQWGYLGALDQALTQASSPTFAGLTLDAGITATKIVDEDNMASDSNVFLSTQQSIKAYILGRFLNIAFSSNWSGVVDKAITPDKVYDQFVEVANEMTALKYCLNFEGVWDATGGTAPDATPADGDYWIVTTAGNWNGVDWELLDWIVWEANTAKWYKVKYFRQFPVVEVSGNKSIQTAIDQIIHMGGGIIKIHSGTYNDGNDVFPLTINDAGAGFFLNIKGVGDTTIIDPNGDSTIFSITNIGKLILEDFKIDATDLTTATKEIINITEASNNPVIVRSITIVGDNTNGYGIEINSNNCKVESCDISTINIGINTLGNDNTIQQNIINSCNSYGIQIKGNENSLYDNESDNNAVGIYLDTADYNQINGNYIEGNTLNGISLNSSNYNALNDNYCIGNDSNTANPQGGIVIDTDSDFNTIISNTSINNNNAGAGIGYGILINNANCLGNKIKDNNCSGNDVQYKDVGTNTDIMYRCSTAKEIQDALDSIDDKSGTVHILPIAGGIQLSAIITVDGGGDYIIEGEGVGSLLDCAGDRTAISITSATSCILRNFKIDANDLTTATTPVISINEGSDRKVIIENITIDMTASKGWGIYIQSNNIIVRNCSIADGYYGLYLTGVSNCIITGNIISPQFDGIYTTSSSNIMISNNKINAGINGISFISTITESMITTNIITAASYCLRMMFTVNKNVVIGNTLNNSSEGVHLEGGDYNVFSGNTCHGNFNGIKITNSNYNIISGNQIGGRDVDNAEFCGGVYLNATCIGNIIELNMIHEMNNIGAGASYGVYIALASDVENIIGNNNFHDLDGDIFDAGTDTVIYADDTVYGVGWNGNLGTATKNAIYDELAKGLDGAFDRAKIIDGANSEANAFQVGDGTDKLKIWSASNSSWIETSEANNIIIDSDGLLQLRADGTIDLYPSEQLVDYLRLTVVGGNVVLTAGGGGALQGIDNRVNSTAVAIGLVAMGTYVGDGSLAKFITTGFMPKYIYIIQDVGADDGDCDAFHMVMNTAGDRCQEHSGNDMKDNSIFGETTNGFYVDDDGANLHPNEDGTNYCYFAIG